MNFKNDYPFLTQILVFFLRINVNITLHFLFSNDVTFIFGLGSYLKVIKFSTKQNSTLCTNVKLKIINVKTTQFAKHI